MNIKLFIEAILKFILGIILVGLLIFIPAGTFNYLNGWIFMGVLFIPMFIVGIIMMIKDPNLLKSRLDAKEEQGEQRKVVAISGLMFISGFILAGLNYRFSWYILPNYIVIISAIIFLLSYVLYGLVLKENSYLSRTIKVHKEQKVIDTGIYKIIRHPMYLATIFLFLSMPLILGSLISFVIFLIYPFLIIKRIKNEEEVLEKNLDGYKKYKNKVKYKLIPFIW